MDTNPTSPNQAIASLTSIAPFLWPFVLLSLGVALTPVSPISWSYSTWMLFIIPLIITVFAPIRTFSGPLRYAYLEYASKIASLSVSLLKAVITNFHSVPTLALPALFFLPVLPILFFVFFPALPMAWHFIAYHYRRRLKAVTTSTDTTNAKLDLAITRTQQAVALAHTYEKQALYSISTTRSVPLLALPRHSTDFDTPASNDSEGQRLVQRPGTLGADLAGKVLDTEKMMADIENNSREVRALTKQAVSAAVEGDMAEGDKLADDAENSLEKVDQQVDELRSVADQARCMWTEYRRRLNAVTTYVSTTTASLDLIVTHARQANALAHTYEKQALYTISTTQSAPLLALPRHSTDFSTPASDNSEGQRLVQRAGTLGGDLTGKVLDAEKQMTDIEDDSREVRTLLEQAVAVAVEGDMAEGEKLADEAANSLENVNQQVDELRSVADQARCTWIEYRRRLNMVTTSASTTIARLDLIVTRARRAATLAHTYETQALSVVSTTRRTASLTLALHSVDFFDTSVSAWAAMGHATAETKDLVVAVRDILPLADNLRQSQAPSQNFLSTIHAEELYERTNDVFGAALKAEQEARQAQRSVARSKNAQSLVTGARQLVNKEAERVRVLGAKLTEKMLDVERKISDVESRAENIRALLEKAVVVAMDGDVAKGETLTNDAANRLRSVDECMHGLCSVGDEVRQAWVALSVEAE